ncbi:unnamed protein product [Caenorhabditis brenneri]
MTANNELDHDFNCGSMKISLKNFKETNSKSTCLTKKILNIPWNFVVSESDGTLKFKLSCNENSANTMWNCQAEIDILIGSSNTESGNIKRCDNMPSQKVFDYKNRFIEGILNVGTEPFKKDNMEIEVRLKMNRIYGYRKRKIINYLIEHPRFSNGVVLIDGRHIHINKQILGMHSKFFYNLFFGDFKEKDKKITEIQGVGYNEFLLFLDFIHPTGRQIEERFVEDLMELADLFLADRVMDCCEEFLIKADSLDVVKRLIWAEKFSLCGLMDHSLNSLKTMEQFIRLKKSEDYYEMSDEIKSSLLERATQLHKQRNLHNI